MNAGKCIIKGYLSETVNYLESETPEYILNVILKSPANFIVDRIPEIPVKTSYQVTLNNGTYDPEVYEITCQDRNIIINKNIISSNHAGEYKIYVTKKATFEYKALVKKIKIIISKLNQPVINISGLETDIFVSSSKGYKLSLNNMYDNPYTKFVITKNLPLNENNYVCLLIDNTLYGISEGICYIKAVVNETTNYNYQETKEIKITVKRKEQSKLIFNNNLELKVGETIPLNIIGGSSNKMLVVKSRSNNAFVKGTVLSGVVAGFVSVTATMDGDDEYYPTSTTVRFTIYKNDQKVQIEKINLNNELYVGDKTTLFTNNIRENAKIKYIISDYKEPICYVVNNQLITTGAGSCSIQGVISETKNYNETKTDKMYIKIIKKQQEKLIVNGKTSHGNYIKINTDYNNYNYINVGGGNTNKVSVNSSNDNCKIVEIN